MFVLFVCNYQCGETLYIHMLLYSKNVSKGLKKTETCPILTFFEQNPKWPIFHDTEKVIKGIEKSLRYYISLVIHKEVKDYEFTHSCWKKLVQVRQKLILKVKKEYGVIIPLLGPLPLEETRLFALKKNISQKSNLIYAS